MSDRDMKPARRWSALELQRMMQNIAPRPLEGLVLEYFMLRAQGAPADVLELQRAMIQGASPIRIATSTVLLLDPPHGSESLPVARVRRRRWWAFWRRT